MWRVLQMLADKSRTRRPRNTRIGRKVVYPTGNNAHQFQGQRLKSRSPGRLMLRPEVRHIFQTDFTKFTNFKLGTQTKHEDQYRGQAPWPPVSKVKVARSRGPSVSCWQSKVENEKSQKHQNGRKVAHATGNNAIIDSPCVTQFYLLKLVTGNHWNQTATGMKFAVRVNGRMRSIEFCIKIIVGKN